MRSVYCGELNESHLDQEVTLCGWVHRRRDHGGVIFVDLRDHKGLVQVVFDPDREAVFATAERIRNEYVLQVQGQQFRNVLLIFDDQYVSSDQCRLLMVSDWKDRPEI